MLLQTLDIRRRCFDFIRNMIFISDYFERKIADLLGYGPYGSYL